jgi:hypothetical protein
MYSTKFYLDMKSSLCCGKLPVNKTGEGLPTVWVAGKDLSGEKK